jgi:hypothetical protein
VSADGAGGAQDEAALAEGIAHCLAGDLRACPPPGAWARRRPSRAGKGRGIPQVGASSTNRWSRGDRQYVQTLLAWLCSCVGQFVGQWPPSFAPLARISSCFGELLPVQA